MRKIGNLYTGVIDDDTDDSDSDDGGNDDRYNRNDRGRNGHFSDSDNRNARRTILADSDGRVYTRTKDRNNRYGPPIELEFAELQVVDRRDPSRGSKNRDYLDLDSSDGRRYSNSQGRRVVTSRSSNSSSSSSEGFGEYGEAQSGELFPSHIEIVHSVAPESINRLQSMVTGAEAFISEKMSFVSNLKKMLPVLILLLLLAIAAGYWYGQKKKKK